MKKQKKPLLTHLIDSVLRLFGGLTLLICSVYMIYAFNFNVSFSVEKKRPTKQKSGFVKTLQKGFKNYKIVKNLIN